MYRPIIYIKLILTLLFMTMLACATKEGSDAGPGLDSSSSPAPQETPDDEVVGFNENSRLNVACRTTFDAGNGRVDPSCFPTLLLTKPAAVITSMDSNRFSAQEFASWLNHDPEGKTTFDRICNTFPADGTASLKRAVRYSVVRIPTALAETRFLIRVLEKMVAKGQTKNSDPEVIESAKRLSTILIDYHRSVVFPTWLGVDSLSAQEYDALWLRYNKAMKINFNLGPGLNPSPLKVANWGVRTISAAELLAALRILEVDLESHQHIAVQVNAVAKEYLPILDKLAAVSPEGYFKSCADDLRERVK